MSFRNLLAKGAFAAQMIDLGLPHIVQNLKAQAWSDEVRMLQNLLNYKHSMEDCQQLKHCLNLFWAEIVGRCMPKNEPSEIYSVLGVQ